MFGTFSTSNVLCVLVSANIVPLIRDKTSTLHTGKFEAPYSISVKKITRQNVEHPNLWDPVQPV